MKWNINEDALNKRIDKLSSWDDWSILEEEFFQLSNWPEKPLEILESESARSDVEINGCWWKPVIDPLEVPPEIQYLYEKSRLRVFSKLEPEAAENNSKHPEWYGKWCIYCEIWTEVYPEWNCPSCGKEVLPIVIND
ncbi:hypothetical protein [Cohnella yongneupensis]|uniref:Rubredoxin-like domain-containing protein n=1 Tax=Cohnella yongneupensis TaxID=425006 RepID=A0ABW0QXF8_9BACL